MRKKRESGQQQDYMYLYQGNPGDSRNGNYPGNPGDSRNGNYPGNPEYFQNQNFPGNPVDSRNGNYPGNPVDSRNGNFPGNPGYSARDRKPAKPFNPIPLLLVAGVLFLFLGGVAFLSNAWDMLPDGCRAAGLLSVSAVAFTASQLAEKKFHLSRTGMAFFVLGCIFLPLALAGIGIFQLWGEWFTFSGEGCFLLSALLCLSVGIPMLAGQHRYQQVLLAGCSLLGFAGAWFFLSESVVCRIEIPSISCICRGVLLTGFAVAATFAARHYRNDSVNPLTEAAPACLYFTYLCYGILLTALHTASPGIACCFLLGLAVLFCNPDFISGRIHTGIFGMYGMLLAACCFLAALFPQASALEKCLFVPCCMGMILFAFHGMPCIRKEGRQACLVAGIVCTVPAFLSGTLSLLVWKRQIVPAGILLYLLTGIAVSVYIHDTRAEISGKRLAFLCRAGMLVLTGILACATPGQSDILLLLLVCSALLLLAQSFWQHTTDTLVLAIGAGGSILCAGFPHALTWELLLLWIMLLAGAIYAHRTGRDLLELCCALGGIAAAVPACFSLLTDGVLSKLCYHLTGMWRVDSSIAWTGTLGMLALCYLLEIFLFRTHKRSDSTKPYIEIASLPVAAAVFLSRWEWQGILRGAKQNVALQTCSDGMLLVLLLLFAGGLLRRKQNSLAILPLLAAFPAYLYLMEAIAPEHPVVQIISCVLLVGVYAGMGRILLPKGFLQTDKGFQLDWAVLAGVLPLLRITFLADWRPEVLTFLLLACYAALFIGRTAVWYVPAVIASANSCLALFFWLHPDKDGILAALGATGMQTQEVFGCLLPVHLFLFSLRWILPVGYRYKLSFFRFGLYCLTMTGLLLASLQSGHLTDALLSVGISLAILVSSFTVKQLRWFTLGFSALFLLTIRLTWNFWTSLHWGIYLFLAGMILIGIATGYEYITKFMQKHADNPEKRFRLFAEWTW